MTSDGAEFRIGVDVGGTFTDVTVLAQDGLLIANKALTNPHRFWLGARDALELIAQELDVTSQEILARTSLFVLGTTRATNAVIEHTTARTAYLTTQGFPDALVMRLGGTENAFDFSVADPEPYVPRHLTFEVPERVNGEGDVLKPLDRNALGAILREVRASEVEAVAVCLLWSMANPDHEIAVGQMIEEILPGVPYTLSHRLNPIVGEYRRSSSSAIDASLKPLMQGYVDAMRQDLTAAGLTGELLIATCYGGSIPAAGLIDKPILSVNSGPALAPVAARLSASESLSTGDAIVCDVGGTTFDVSLVQKGEIRKSRETWIGPRFTGHLTGFSAVDVKSVGAGGGSIAWVDEAGLLRVGPQSAGAEPGPACYGRGGTRPTVTDAAVCLGYLQADRFLGGRMRLDSDAAAVAVDRHVAQPLGLDLYAAAHGILTVSNETMVTALTDVTIGAGVDPREYAIVAGGGGAGLGILAIAEALGCRRVLVPRTAPVLSATGALFSEIVVEFGVSRPCDLEHFPISDVNERLASLEAQMDAFITELPPRAVESITKTFTVDARYHDQAWELEVALPAARVRGDHDLRELKEGFHRVHERVFGVRQPDETIECLHWTGRVVGSAPAHPAGRVRPTESRSAASHRPAYFSGHGMVSTPQVDGRSLAIDQVVEGPAIITEPLTTIVVYPGWTGRISAAGDCVLSQRAEPEPR